MMMSSLLEMDRVRSLMEDLLENAGQSAGRFGELSLANLYENEKSYMLQFLAPGVKQSDVSVDYTNGMLSVSLKREIELPKEVKMLRSERSSENYTRKFRIASDVDVEGIEAKLVDGILLVAVPKKPEVQPKKISVKVN